MCYKLPLGVCSRYTAVPFCLLLAAAGSTIAATVFFFQNPDHIMYAVNGDGVCLEVRVSANPVGNEYQCPAAPAGLQQCGGSSTCCYSGYGCAMGAASGIKYCENQCRIPNAQCESFVDPAAPFEYSKHDIPLRASVYASTVAGLYMFVLAVSLLASGTTARCVQPCVAIFFMVCHLGCLGAMFILKIPEFFCDMNRDCFNETADKRLGELCDALGLYITVGAVGLGFMVLSSCALVYRGKKIVRLREIARTRYLVDDETEELLDEKGKETSKDSPWAVSRKGKKKKGKRVAPDEGVEEKPGASSPKGTSSPKKSKSPTKASKTPKSGSPKKSKTPKA